MAADNSFFSPAALGAVPGVPKDPACGAEAPPFRPDGVRRVLAVIDLAARGEAVVGRARDIAVDSHADLLAVHVIDSRVVFESDGPCGYLLASERFSRRTPAAARRLELLLARNNAAWAESAVLCGDTNTALTDLVARWRPDVVVVDAREARHPSVALALERAGRSTRVHLLERTDAGAAVPRRRRAGGWVAAMFKFFA
jgi:nucleotide-binding universal stress UspA family protein